MFPFFRRVISLCLLAGGLLGSGLPAVSQNAPASFTIENKDAKAAFDRGMNAAKRRAWDEAIDGFLKAHENTSNPNPIIYFNLGLALEKANQPLLAAMCLTAYLALMPQAANATEVRNEIASLERASTAKLTAIFKTMDANAATLRGYQKSDAYALIAKTYARVGDMENAIAAAAAAMRVGEGGYSVDLKASLWITNAHSLVRIGYRAKALDIMEMVESRYPIPPNYKTDSTLDGALRNDYRFREDEIEEVKLSLQHPGESLIDNAFVKISGIISGYQLYRDDRRKNPGKPIPLIYIQYDLDGGIRKALVPLKKSESGSFSDFEKLNVIQAGPAYAVIASMGEIAGGYGSEMLEYQYVKDKLSK